MAFFLDTFVDTPGTLLSAHTPNVGSYASADAHLVIEADTGGSAVKVNEKTAAAYALTTQTGAGADVQCTLDTHIIGGYEYIDIIVRYDSGTGNAYMVRQLTNTGAGGASVVVYRSTSLSPGSTIAQWTGLTLGVGTHEIIFKITNDITNGWPLFDLTVDGVAQTQKSDQSPGYFTNQGQCGFGFDPTYGTANDDFITSIAFADALATLTPGTANATQADTSKVILTSTSPTGGSGSYTFAWHRATDPFFTPSSGTRLTSLGSHQNYNDTTATSYIQFYCVEAFDGTDTVYSNVVGGRLWKSALNLGFIGDSITDGKTPSGDSGTFPGTQCAIAYPQDDPERIVTATNQGVPGSASGDWLSGGTNLNNALAAFASANVNYVFITLGTNDAFNSVSSSDFKSNLQNTISALLGAGITAVILNYPTGVGPWVSGSTTDEYNFLNSYFTEIDSLVNGTTILAGDKFMRFFCLENPALWAYDLVHFISSSYVIMGQLWAAALNRALNPSGGGGTAFVIRPTPMSM